MHRNWFMIGMCRLQRKLGGFTLLIVITMLLLSVGCSAQVDEVTADFGQEVDR
jgi:hypothetical protein